MEQTKGNDKFTGEVSVQPAFTAEPSFDGLHAFDLHALAMGPVPWNVGYMPAMHHFARSRQHVDESKAN